MKKFPRISLALIAIFLAGCNSAVTTPAQPSISQADSVHKQSAAADTVSQPIDTLMSDEFEGCPLVGSAQAERIKSLNILKNRSKLPKPGDFNLGITLSAMLQPGDDKDRWKNNQAARIVGYLKDVKPGGIETSNCKAEDIPHRDAHLELVLNPSASNKNQSIIIEITPRIRKLMSKKGENWNTDMIRSKYLGRWVEIEGWLMYDLEHANMAENTRPGRATNWRASAWEIHPVTKISITSKPQ